MVKQWFLVKAVPRDPINTITYVFEEECLWFPLICTACDLRYYLRLEIKLPVHNNIMYMSAYGFFGLIIYALITYVLI